jgi:AcrR family transcriptional regulator
LTKFDRFDNERTVLKIPNVHYNKMKTRQNYYSNQTYQKIIKSALKLFVKNGYHGTSISDISKAANITKGAIYFHFKNKDALVKKILEINETNYLNKMVEEATSTKGKAIEKMKSLLRFCLNFGVKNRELGLCLTSLSTELCSSSKKYEKDIKKVYKKFHIFLGNLLEEGEKDGSFRKNIDPNILALNLMGALDGTLLQWNMNRNEVNGGDFSRSFMKFFLNGICRPTQIDQSQGFTKKN